MNFRFLTGILVLAGMFLLPQGVNAQSASENEFYLFRTANQRVIVYHVYSEGENSNTGYPLFRRTVSVMNTHSDTSPRNWRRQQSNRIEINAPKTKMAPRPKPERKREIRPLITTLR